MNVNKTAAVVKKLFGNTHAEVCEKLGLTVLNEERYAQNYPFGVHLKPTNTGYKVEVGFKGYVHLIQFSLDYYPSCCGSRLFHTFKVDSRISQDELDEIMEAIIDENKWDDYKGDSSQYLGRSNRIEVMMVELRPNASDRRDSMLEVEPVENPTIHYKPLWNFFHKYAKRVRTRLEVNANTGNVLHNMEVIF